MRQHSGRLQNFCKKRCCFQ